jgi:hypothetical protein
MAAGPMINLLEIEKINNPNISPSMLERNHDTVECRLVEGPEHPTKDSSFREELIALLRRFEVGDSSNTTNPHLANYLCACLIAYERLHAERLGEPITVSLGRRPKYAVDTGLVVEDTPGVYPDSQEDL